MNRRGLGASGVGIGAVLALVVAQPSFASEPAPPVDSGAAVMRTSDAVASGIGLAPAQSEAVDGNAVTVKAGEESFEVTLPVAKTPVEEITSSGLVALADESSFAIVPVSMADGSVAIHSVINDASAPREFAYDLGLPVGATVSVDPKTGSVIALDSDGNFLLGAAAPWARDANGVELPTWYTVQGTSLVQHVTFDEKAAFPIVADPWLGINLVSAISFNWIAGAGWKLNVDPTPWARGLTGNPLWIPAGEAGWLEVIERSSSSERTRLNDSGKNQYICHMGFAGLDPQWNMELWKPNKDLPAWVASQCN